MLPFTHSQIFIKDLNQALFNGLEMQEYNRVGRRDRESESKRQRERQRS